VLSFKMLAALASTCEEAEPPGPPRRERRDWVRGEVRCIMCARLVGRLLGFIVWHDWRNSVAGRAFIFRV
jgi:hypothetical protein